MDSGLYAACAALVARTESLDVAANNLANVNSVGYKRQQVAFKSVLAEKAATGNLNRAINDFGILGGSQTDRTQGTLESTGSEFDCAIEGQGFFAVQTQSGVRYTRDGRFQLSPKGQLVNSEGDPVLGEQGPVQLPTGTLSISNDGTISVNGALVEKLKIVEFDPGVALSAEGRAYYNAPASQAKPAVNSTVKEGAVEASNINPVSSAVELITLQRHAELLQRTISIFHSDFNRIASEELPKL